MRRSLITTLRTHLARASIFMIAGNVVLGSAVATLPVFTAPAFAAGSWYVSATAGNNANDCMTAGTACQTIQAAINKAAAGDTITVSSGIYAEHVTVDKSLTLNGANSAVACRATRGTESVITGVATGAVQITADNVTLNGFQVSSAANNLGSGIWMDASKAGALIKNNLISQSQIGLYAGTAGPATVSCNIFDGNNQPGSSGGAGIYSEYTNGLTVDNNEFKNHNTNNPIIFAATGPSVHDNLTVSNNLLHDNNCGCSAIYVLGVDGGAFTGNDIASQGTDLRFGGGNTNVQVTKNILHGTVRGVGVFDDGYGLGLNTGIVASRNSFTGHSAFGVENAGGQTLDVNASCNWWGAADGPGPVGPGSGDKVSTGVIYSPWLTLSDLDSACNGGAPVKVTIAKYVNDQQATAPNANSTSFSMHAIFPGGEGDYPLGPVGFNNPNPYTATTSDMAQGSEYSTYENPTTPCTDAYPFDLEGYSTGDTMSGAVAASPTMTVPAFTNLTSDKFVVVWNKTCPPAPVHVSPPDNSTWTTAQADKIDWTDVTSDPSMPITYRYEVATTDTSTNPDGSFVNPVYVSGPLAVSEIPVAGTPEGVYHWHVRAVDAAGNSSVWTTPWTITIDNSVSPPPPPPPPPAPVCGDNVIQGAEQCDDGNVVNGDGCSSVCQSEALVCAPTDDDLVAYWRLDESGSTIAVDSTGNGHDGAVTGTTQGGPGATEPTYYNGGSYAFNGTTDVITTNGSDFNFGSTNFTVSMYAKSVTANRSVLGHYDNAGAGYRGWGLYFGNNQVNFFGYGTTGVNDSAQTAVILDDTWHHITGVFTRNAGDLTIESFVDGVSVGTSTSPVGDIGITTDMLIGKYTFQPNYQGSLDDIRVYDRALTAAEVADISGGTCDLTPPPPGPLVCTPTDSNLAGYWKFDENAGTTTADSSPNNNPGALNGPTWTTSTGMVAFSNTAALSFDGIDDYVAVGDVASLDFQTAGKFSATAWIYSSGTSGYQTILHKLDDSTGARNGYLFTLDNGTPELWLLSDYGANNYLVKAGAAPVTAGAWHQIGFSYDGSGTAAGVKIYVDGVDQTGISLVDALTGSIDSTKPFEIGYRSIAAAQAFNGVIDDVRVYSDTLGAAQFSALYAGQCNAGPFTPPPPPPPADTDGDTVNDATDNCVNDVNTDQGDVDNDGIGDVCDPTNNNPSFTNQHQQTEDVNTDQDEGTARTGSHRGSQTNRLMGVSNFIGGSLVSDNAGAAFGGGTAPFSDEDKQFICAMKKALPAANQANVKEWLGEYLAGQMGRDITQVTNALENESFCASVPNAAAPVVTPVSIRLNSEGVVVSSNPVWNVCVSGKPVTKALIESNTDRVVTRRGRLQVSRPKSCSDYHKGDVAVWSHPDFSGLQLTLDTKGHIVAPLPTGYVAVSDTSVSAADAKTVTR